MYSIHWTDSPRGTIVVVGDLRSILCVANILEERKIEFRVASCQGFRCKQEDLGCGGFSYWL